jgi:lycopene cyclase domain-containing protein
LTYLHFHLVFIAGPTLLLCGWALRCRQRLGGRTLVALFGVSPLALLYTARWDQYLIANRVWWYGEDRVTGAWLGVPYEEYAFMVLQPVLTGALLLALLSRRARLERPGWTRHAIKTALIVGGGLVGVGLVGGVMALRAGPEWTYFGLILVWAFPALGALTAGAWSGLKAFGRESALAWATATLYLAVADCIAIGAGVWTISPEQSTGWLIGGLPVEEALFFAVTNALVVAGAMLFFTPGLPPTQLRASADDPVGA